MVAMVEFLLDIPTSPDQKAETLLAMLLQGYLAHKKQPPPMTSQ